MIIIFIFFPPTLQYCYDAPVTLREHRLFLMSRFIAVKGLKYCCPLGPPRRAGGLVMKNDRKRERQVIKVGMLEFALGC
ncbi:hypothetical protein KC345_g176 [Hortaea werneckii]|nr:hypothetical protein KC345_g176 [Hortaea werneckii]